MRAAPTEGWILASTATFPALDDDVAGLPYVLRLACDLVAAGCRTIHVVYEGPAAPSLAPYASDPRLKGATLDIVREPPLGDADDPIVIARAGRICQRDMAKQVVAAWRDSTAPLARLPAGHDSHVVTTRGHAQGSLENLPAVEARLPYLGFTATPRDARSLLRAEKQLVWSLRKAADGIASKAINRHLSLPVTFQLMRTRIHPNHVTVLCFLLACTGAFVISRGGYWAGAIGMLIFNMGSIFDGVDGELARLTYRQGRLGQWLDTVVDDLGNVAYITGITLNLHAAGVTWAAPVGITALGCFATTQLGQYALITLVYKSGDLAAIPWLFQSADFLGAEKPGFWGTVPKLFKRDFALTFFVGLAFCGLLHVILLIFATSSAVFLAVFAVQLARNAGSLRR